MVGQLTVLLSKRVVRTVGTVQCQTCPSCLFWGDTLGATRQRNPDSLQTGPKNQNRTCLWFCLISHRMKSGTGSDAFTFTQGRISSPTPPYQTLSHTPHLAQALAVASARRQFQVLHAMQQRVLLHLGLGQRHLGSGELQFQALVLLN